MSSLSALGWDGWQRPKAQILMALLVGFSWAALRLGGPGAYALCAEDPREKENEKEKQTEEKRKREAKDASDPALRDRLVLKDGRALEGTLLDIFEGEYVLKVKDGKRFLPVASVKEAVRCMSNARITLWTKNAKEFQGEDKLRRFAVFLRGKGAFPEERICWRRILEASPGDEEAQRGLGRLRLEGRWLSEKEVEAKIRIGYGAANGELVRRNTKGGKSNEGPGESISELVLEGKASEKAGMLEEALHAFQEASFLVPEDKVLEAQVRRLASRVAAAKVNEAKDALSANKQAPVVPILAAAYDLCPTKETASLLMKCGRVRHWGQWRTHAEVKAAVEEEEKAEGRAREALHLPRPQFRKFRTDHFRVFTNMPEGREWDGWLEPVFKVIECALAKFQWVYMGETDTRSAELGLTVVFFRDHDAYEAYLRSEQVGFSFATAGFYDPAKKASFFFRDPSYGQVWPTLLHELTHHFNDLVLHAANSVAWINEGSAQYFEAGIVGQDYSLTLGRPLHSALSSFREERYLEAGKYIPAEKILNAMSVDELARDGYKVHQVYSQMWGWAYFFLHNEHRHRKLLLDCIRAEKQVSGEGAYADVRGIYLQTFEKHGFTKATIDAGYKKFIASVPATQN